MIAALNKHEIGFHAKYHSVEPTPAVYLSNLGWDEGVAEFDRRERPGFDDVKRIFGMAPTCYGQPGSSWGPQSYGAMSGGDACVSGFGRPRPVERQAMLVLRNLQPLPAGLHAASGPEGAGPLQEAEERLRRPPAANC